MRDDFATGRFRAVLAAVFVVVAISAIPLEAQQSDRRDGNWWTTQQTAVRVPFALGFFDGMVAGQSFTIPDVVTIGAVTETCMKMSYETYQKHSNKYLSAITAGQLVDGLDAFYKDYRNRSIMTSQAFELIVRSIAGEDIEQLTIQYRRLPKD